MPSNFNHFPQISEQLHKAVSKVVKKVAFDLQSEAASLAPVDTGFLRNSIYTVTSDKSTYGGGVQKAGSIRANKRGTYSGLSAQRYLGRVARQKAQEAMLLSEVAGPPNEWTAYVAVGASYGIYLEFGTRHMPAKPYFFPAVETARGSFESAIGAIESELS